MLIILQFIFLDFDKVLANIKQISKKIKVLVMIILTMDCFGQTLAKGGVYGLRINFLVFV